MSMVTMTISENTRKCKMPVYVLNPQWFCIDSFLPELQG